MGSQKQLFLSQAQKHFLGKQELNDSPMSRNRDSGQAMVFGQGRPGTIRADSDDRRSTRGTEGAVSHGKAGSPSLIDDLGSPIQIKNEQMEIFCDPAHEERHLG